MKYGLRILITVASLIMSGCNSDNGISPEKRTFKMGFTTWSFGPELQDVNSTYEFIESNADIYAEHIDSNIPWNAWINDLSLPEAFTNEITGRVNRRIDSNELLLSVSLLNSGRNDLAEDFDGSIPDYSGLDDSEIENAYFKHINYLVNRFQPDYLVIAIEVNELRLRAPDKWNDYKNLMQNVKSRIKQEYPDLQISESISLHNLYEPDMPDPEPYIDEMFNYMNQMDFVAISFYPFFKNQTSMAEFQETFDFLHANISRPIAFSETGHIAENLIVPNLGLSLNGNQDIQNMYLESLLRNAGDKQYEFIIWWAHRDFDKLWETFPDEVKDIGQLWRDTGLLDEEGNERLSTSTWNEYFSK